MTSTQDARADAANRARENDRFRQEADERHVRANYVAYISEWFARSQWLDTDGAAPDFDTWIATIPRPALVDKHILMQVANHAYRYVQAIQDRANVLCEELTLPVTGALNFDVWSLHPRHPITNQLCPLPFIPMRSVIGMEEADTGYLIHLIVALAVGKTITERMALQLELRAMHGRKVKMAARRAEAVAAHDTVVRTAAAAARRESEAAVLSARRAEEGEQLTAAASLMGMSADRWDAGQ
ncbi:hypothetical protein LTR91_004032 [Friedmanniomyces endolithicus]|uniref:Uncharacterized protein n=1 Tax=Friedmanniomyces endolithicus TaxID=329885 RepID=A0A4U0U087_9PEZI|nr:hypothetical protein LTS09_016686 [Friedmanniomyces endolithicus]KAK0265293.1 hypothetical protein LTR35_017157 [Friedmanniomyces endolithicus]KAK0285411.1 hypothetical protein LTS00_010772 [Friedmanniomyces endolithicus]KAK0303061.1 hypothetical protein LTR01_008353 [Friedmanniomyces endolithicus]KAK0315183.1 hypothetical protein LTR82_012742 [Friedmanniomyces endolithicus]